MHVCCLQKEPIVKVLGIIVVSKLRSPILSILGEFCSEIDDHLKIYTFSTSFDDLACSQLFS